MGEMTDDLLDEEAREESGHLSPREVTDRRLVGTRIPDRRRNKTTIPPEHEAARLRSALRDFVALMPADRWALLRPETIATVRRSIR